MGTVHVLFSCIESYKIIIHINNFDAAVLYISALPELILLLFFIT